MLDWSYQPGGDCVEAGDRGSLAHLSVLVGCPEAVPKAVTSETEHDFGDLPVKTDQSQVRVKKSVIMNDGTADLQLSDVEIQTLEGCCPPRWPWELLSP